MSELDKEPHPLVAQVDDILKDHGLEPIAKVSEDGVRLCSEISNDQARVAINRDIRRRFVEKELSTGVSTIEERSNLYNDGLEKTWINHLKMDVIPKLKA